MKKVVGMAVLIAAGIYLSGLVAFTDNAVNQFLNDWEEATAHGDPQAICDTATDDLELLIEDQTTPHLVSIEGGREQYCDYLQQAVPAMSTVVQSMQLTRDDFKVVQGRFPHWWTAEVSYTEHRTMRMLGGVTVTTISEDQLVLVKTWSGLKLKKLEAHSYLDGGS